MTAVQEIEESIASKVGRLTREERDDPARGIQEFGTTENGEEKIRTIPKENYQEAADEIFTHYHDLMKKLAE